MTAEAHRLRGQGTGGETLSRLGPTTQRRVGVLIPSSNTSVESELSRALAPGVSLHSSRLSHFTGVDPAAVEVMVADIARASALLATAAVDLLFLCATVPSLLRGPGYDREIAERIRQHTGIFAETTSSAMIAALRAVGARRIVLGTPFIPAMNERIVSFLTGSGFDVLAHDGLGIEDNLTIGRLEPQSVVDVACAIDRPDADAVLLACTNWRTLASIDTLEARLGKPVITTTQASVWHILRALGLPATLPGHGRLLAGRDGRVDIGD
jgi:maleate cis-trans isomerase